MKKLYILPGWKDTPNLPPYEQLAKAAKTKGYKVEPVVINWKKKMSTQVFAVEENAVIFGFSLGALLGLKVSQNNKCKHLILGSMAVANDFDDKKFRKSYDDLLGKEYVDDFLLGIYKKSLAAKVTTVYGAEEDEKGDIAIPNTGHELSDAYIKKVISLL